MAGENFQIYTVQITGKCIYETFPPSLYDLIIRTYVKQSLHKFDEKSLFSHEKLFQEKKFLPYFFLGRRRHYALSLYLLPFLKALSLTFVNYSLSRFCKLSNKPTGCFRINVIHLHACNLWTRQERQEYLGFPESGHDNNLNDFAFSISC